MGMHDEQIVHISTKPGKPDVDGVSRPVVKRTVIEGCNVTPAGTRETIGEQAPITGRWLVSTSEPHDEIRSRDEIEWRGRIYPVLGDVQTNYGVLAHTEFIITKTRG